MAGMRFIRKFDKDEDFYENDEPVEDVIAAFHAGAKGVTARPLIFDVAGAALPEPTSRTLPARLTFEAMRPTPITVVAMR